MVNLNGDPIPLHRGTTVQFSSTGSGNDRPDVYITKYEWDLDGDGQYETVPEP